MDYRTLFTLPIINATNMENKKPERIVNRHYISIIREVNNYLKYEEVDIPQEDILIGEIETMKKNENHTILDVQALLTKFYPEEEFEGEYYNYLYPNSYSSTYVSGASYPKILTLEEYELNLVKNVIEYLTEYCKEMDNIKLIKKNSTKEEYKAKVEELAKNKMQDYKNSLREEFNYQNFIFAHKYTSKLKELKKESSVKMYSTDQIGWKDFEYKVNDDITIYIKTNFGYGKSSYFFCNLKYKDINILPYSWVVRYYYVEMTYFIRYTRCYSPERISWDEVFDFTVKTANMAKHEHEKFIKKWIVDEVQEMMKSMRLYMSIPEKELEKFLNPKISSNPFELHEVKEYTLKNVIRNCNNRDIEEYKALPKEKVIAFKAEKITGSLLLLDNLRKLTEIATSIIPCIAEIEKMNLKLLPEIESHMKNISANIKQLNFRLDEVVRTLEPLEILFESHKMQIEKMRKEINEGREEKERINEWEAEEDYEEKHPYYVELSNKIKKLTEEKKELEKDINRRKNFFKILTKCKKRITKYIKVA